MAVLVLLLGDGSPDATAEGWEGASIRLPVISPIKHHFGAQSVARGIFFFWSDCPSVALQMLLCPKAGVWL